MKQKSWISIVFSFASQCRGKIVLSVLCAIISVIAGLIPEYFERVNNGIRNGNGTVIFLFGR